MSNLFFRSKHHELQALLLDGDPMVRINWRRDFFFFFCMELAKRFGAALENACK